MIFIRTILSITILPVYHFVSYHLILEPYAILEVVWMSFSYQVLLSVKYGSYMNRMLKGGGCMNSVLSYLLHCSFDS